LLFIWKKLFNATHAGWKYALITLIGGSFFILNHYFFHAPFYSLLARSYAVIFRIVYYMLHEAGVGFVGCTAGEPIGAAGDYSGIPS